MDFVRNYFLQNPYFNRVHSFIWHLRVFECTCIFKKNLYLCKHEISRENANVTKEKSPEVPFHRITSSYSYFEDFEFLHQFIKQEAKHDQEKISAEQVWKVCWQIPTMFCLFTHQANIQICCTVKLILWNVVT